MATELCIECNEYPRVRDGLYCERHQWEPGTTPRFGSSSTAVDREGATSNALGGSAIQENNDVFGSNTSGKVTGASSAASVGMLTGMFRDRESTEKAYGALRSRGYGDDDVNLMMSDETRDTWFADDDSALGSKAMEGAGTGSAIGGTLGAIIGGIAAIGTNVLIPGLGLVVAGPIAAALAGAGAGGLTGGLVGALIGSGIPEDRAKVYESGINEGSAVIGVTPRNQEDADYFENEFRNYRGEHIYR